MTRFSFILSILLLTVSTACRSYYNDTIMWADNIKVGTDIQTVKNSKPDFIEINWNQPDTFDNKICYLITKIKGNRDILGMSNYLVFTDNKYQGRRPHK
jgi:hypothetical protein